MAEKKKQGRNVSDPMRVLKVLQVLKKYSDSNNRMSQSGIMEKLKNDEDIDYSCDAKTLSKALREMILVLNPPPQSLTGKTRDEFIIRYKDWDSGCIPQRITGIYYKPYIEVSEMQAIADGIKQLDTISREQKEKIISKLKKEYNVSFDSEGDVSVFSADDCEALAVNTAVIAQAAKKCMEITFNFGGYDRSGEVVPRCDDSGKPRIYRAVPYYVVSYRGKRYMLCCYIRSNGEYTDNVSIYRVDLMRNITVTDKPGRMINAVREFVNTNADEYIQKHPDMTYGQPITVRLKVKAEYYTLIHDTFGMSYEFVRQLDDTYDEIKVTTSEKGIIDLAMSWPDRIEIISPASLRKKLAERAKDLIGKYKE
ncbi:Predicted DNA-binding transcriptional regulator YafY, contains an HTH and WYL domains [Ruminococcaceae bacterium FB2012]|nr:Predicted DNA-binding transcriptional regulator YafY, contains an HTH and WYL domains [Ruminococcaceae bacterium FB2012]